MDDGGRGDVAQRGRTCPKWHQSCSSSDDGVRGRLRPAGRARRRSETSPEGSPRVGGAPWLVLGRKKRIMVEEENERQKMEAVVAVGRSELGHRRPAGARRTEG